VTAGRPAAGSGAPRPHLGRGNSRAGQAPRSGGRRARRSAGSEPCRRHRVLEKRTALPRDDQGDIAATLARLIRDVPASAAGGDVQTSPRCSPTRRIRAVIDALRGRPRWDRQVAGSSTRIHSRRTGGLPAWRPASCPWQEGKAAGRPLRTYGWKYGPTRWSSRGRVQVRGQGGDIGRRPGDRRTRRRPRS